MAEHSGRGGADRDPRAEMRRAASRAARAAKAGVRQARRRAASAGEELRSLQSGLRSRRDLRIGFVEAGPFPAGIGTAVDLGASGTDVGGEIRRGVDLVTVGAGSPGRIADRTLEVLLACEQAGIPMVLLVDESRQLDTPTAAVVTHAATPNEDVHRELLDRMGPQRTFLIRAGESPRAQARRLLRLL